MLEKITERLDLVAQHRHVGAKIASRERDGERWNPQRQALHCRGHRAGVEDILSHVLAVVDAAENEIRTFRHQRFDGKHHAVRGRAVDLKSAVTPFDRAHRVMQGQRMTRRALLSIRCNYRDFSKWCCCLYEAFQPVRENPVVIGAQQSQRWKIPARWRHKTLMTSQASLNSRK